MDFLFSLKSQPMPTRKAIPNKPLRIPMRVIFVSMGVEADA
jgi:hypothetical protein